jgi:hypothetical protein
MTMTRTRNKPLFHHSNTPPLYVAVRTEPHPTAAPLHHSTSRFGRSLTLPRHRYISPSLHHSTLRDLRAMLSPIRVVLALKPRYPRKFFR